VLYKFTIFLYFTIKLIFSSATPWQHGYEIENNNSQNLVDKKHHIAD